MKKSALILLLPALGLAQNFSKTDTLKGSDTHYRNFWDVQKYEVTVEPRAGDRSVSGSNRISFAITKDISAPTFQIDLQQPMDFRILGSDMKGLMWSREGDFIFIKFKNDLKKGERHYFDIAFSGHPKIAKKAPWDGGWVFAKDSAGKSWMSVAQEGAGASLWLPLKDIWSDEPEQGISMKIITDEGLAGVGNGRLLSSAARDGRKAWSWTVKNPINAYSIVPTVGDFVNFKDEYQGEKGTLSLDYWVLRENLDKAKTQFAQVKPMLAAFEHWFGPYPFYEDSYKLVETPYLGMEHQSNVAYGNHYENGYLGRDWSGTGVGLKWDFIIIHESGHEWFANNITAKDQADMWVHEAFTCYAETLYTEYNFGKADAEKYIIGIRKNIANDTPIIGRYGVRNEGSGDMYWKGANMVHTIRTVINDDEKFRAILRGLNKDFYHQTVSGRQVEDYVSQKAGIDFSSVFDQYLRTVQIPVLEYVQEGGTLKFRYASTVPGFRLPLRINGGRQTIYPNENWQSASLADAGPVQLDPNYYVTYSRVE